MSDLPALKTSASRRRDYTKPTVRATALARLLLITVGADILCRASGAPIPGAAVALLALTACYAATGGPLRGDDALFDVAVAHLPLLFVPAGVGFLVAASAAPAALMASLVAATVVTLAVLASAGLAAEAALKVADARQEPAR